MYLFESDLRDELLEYERNSEVWLTLLYADNPHFLILLQYSTISCKLQEADSIQMQEASFGSKEFIFYTWRYNHWWWIGSTGW